MEGEFVPTRGLSPVALEQRLDNVERTGIEPVARWPGDWTEETIRGRRDQGSRDVT